MKLFLHKLFSLSCSCTSCPVNIPVSVFLSFLLFNAAQAIMQPHGNVTIQAVFAFGDSIVDTGNNNNLQTLSKSNFPPYGRDFQGGKATGRFSNGKVPSDMIVEAYGIKELLPAYLDPNLQSEDLPTGVNFASAASGFDTMTPELMQVLSLEDQLKLFKEYIEKLKELVGDETAHTILTNSVYVVSGASNDIANTYFHTPIRILQYNVSAYCDFLVSSASSFLEELYRLGARIVFFFSAPPLGCLPSQRTLDGGPERKCVGGYNEMAKLYNSKASAELEKINSKFKQARMIYIDTYTILLDMTQNPENYGFEVPEKGCCGTGMIEVSILCREGNPLTCKNASTYIFWDSYHPTERAYRTIVHKLLPDLEQLFLH